uniref:Uncharacterized protein n=1 Tax=Acrobeloides nanus TaxID=290746 RepID=A0A914EH44_9BILA
MDNSNVRRPVRPSFAEDVYGTPGGRPDSGHQPEMCESSLAQRRAAQLPKLKEISHDIKPSMDLHGTRIEMDEIDCQYGDCDSYCAELGELYSYSEMDDWSTNMEAFTKYMDEKNQDSNWSSLSLQNKKRILIDISQRLENSEPHIRHEAMRILLYLLQGAYRDFKDSDEGDEVSIGTGVDVSVGDKGTGEFEEDCLISGATNAYMLQELGLIQLLYSTLLVETHAPFDQNLCSFRAGSRTSSASNSRSASNLDLADSLERKHHRRSATLADNEALRIICSIIYHVVESIRREDLIELIASKSDYTVKKLQMLRENFVAELDDPVEGTNTPLVHVLFDMMPTFVRGNNPHFPMKKILLITWKILLTILGGFDALRKEKAQKRRDSGLPPMEDTLEVAAKLKPTRISEGDAAIRNFGGVRLRTNPPPRSFSRQLACTSTDGNLKSDDEEDTPGEIGQGRRGGSSDEDDGNDGLLGVDGDDDVLLDRKTPDDEKKEEPAKTSKQEEDIDLAPVKGKQPEPSTPVPAQSVQAPKFTDKPRFRNTSGNTGRGDVTPRATSPEPLSKLPWSSKVRESDVEAFLQSERQKFFGYKLPSGDSNTIFGLPPPVYQSVAAFRRHLYVALGDLQIEADVNYNRFPFSQRENVRQTPTECLYRRLLPNMSDYVIALLKMLLAALPSSKAKGDAVSILSDVLTPETDNNEMLSNSINLDTSNKNVLEDVVRVAIDINRHKEIVVKACSAILILLLKWFRLNHVYQFENLSQCLVLANCLPLVLKFLDQNMCRYVQSKHELAPFNYPHAPLYYARNGDEWPTLNVDNVDNPETESRSYYLWRNVFSSINLLRVLNKLTKWKHARTMMLVVFKSAPILKRCLKVKLGLFQLYVLKLLKMQARYLGRQWRKSNMEIISAIYMNVRHRLNDDWAFANETRSKSWDFQSEERELKIAVEKFNSRRYAHLYPVLAIDQQEIAASAKDYLDKTDLSEFEPVDNSIQSVLSYQPEFSERFKKNYSKWLEEEVFKKSIDWERILINSQDYICYLYTRRNRFLSTSPISYYPNKICPPNPVTKTPFQEAALNATQNLYFDPRVTSDDPEVQDLKNGILAGSRSHLARAITLVESKHPRKRAQGNFLLKEIMVNEKKRFEQKGTDSLIFRVGISGSPGVGKSSFIEVLGETLIKEMGKRVAVLTVDPTSATTGSVLGDLTRMQNLSRNPKAYIRQSPTSGALGGVTRGIHEAIILCEGAGYDIVLIETVGVGQSEYAVNEMCDMFVLLLSPAHGDELQGVKKGIMEQSDLLVVTKCDGELEAKARLTRAEYISALKYMKPKSDVWKPKVIPASIYKPETILEISKKMYEFWDVSSKSGNLLSKRNQQLTTWMWNHVNDELINLFKSHPEVMRLAKLLEREIRIGKTTPGMAAEQLLRTFFGVKENL